MNNIFFPQLQKMKNLPSTENLNLLFCDVMEQMMLCNGTEAADNNADTM